MNFKTEICTIDNWGPEWIRILDGKFMPIDNDVHDEKPMTREEYKESKHKKCIAYRDGLEITCNSVNELAEFLGRNQAIISKAFKEGYKVKSYVDDYYYTVKRLSG